MLVAEQQHICALALELCVTRKNQNLQVVSNTGMSPGLVSILTAKQQLIPKAARDRMFDVGLMAGSM